MHSITVLTYYQSQNSISENQLSSSFSLSSINNFGEINKVLKNFCSKKSDILINYYDKNDINLKYVSSRCIKNLSVGFTNVDHELNDLIIDVDAKCVNLFLEECEKYLNSIYNYNESY